VDQATPKRQLAKRRAPKPRAARKGPQQVIRLGWKPQRRRDLYHWFQELPWWAVASMSAGAYLVMNLAFALIYLGDPGGIENAKPGSLADAFFFSVQTMGTIGFGSMYPKSLFANVVVTAETVVGLLSFALITGLLFARFSRPSARVMFSEAAVIAPRDGAHTLMFRMANERRNHILQAEVRVTLLRTERTKEGSEFRRQHDLALVRNQSSFFSQSWLVMHVIDRESPLFGLDAQSFEACEPEIAVLLAGVDETLAQTIYARFTYFPEHIHWNRRFVDVLTRDGSGRLVLDLANFHETRPIGGA
jgi:inward rectifier potassium channel